MLLKVASYNVQSADHGKSCREISKELSDLGISIAGIQELDKGTKRSFGLDVLKEISSDGLPYTVYAPTMDFDGGQYGIGMLAKVPLKHEKTVRLSSFDFEPRVLMICSCEIEGKKIYAANTHLCYENKETRQLQMKEVAEELKNYQPLILFGDFNISDFRDYGPIPYKRVNSEENRLESFKGDIPFRAIDNIFYSDEIRALKACLNESESSDHNMVYAEIEI